MDISIVITTRNRPHYLRECLQSIEAQSDRNFEVIVSNDCGSDVSNIGNYTFPLHHLRNSRPQGQFATLNKGIKAAEGRLIALCDDDDLFHPDHLKELKEFLDKQPAPAMVFSDVIAFSGGIDNAVGFMQRDLDMSVLRKTNYICFCSIMFPKSLFTKVKGFDEDLPSYADWDFHLKVAKVAPILRLPKILSYYRIHEGSHQTVTHPIERREQINRFSRRHHLGNLPLKHLFDNFSPTKIL